jgi:superfamily II DNA/RNA helicase
MPDKDRKFVPDVKTLDQVIEKVNKKTNVGDIYQDDNEVTVENYPHADLSIFQTWEDAGFIPQILDNIHSNKNYLKPREFQQKTMPIIMEGFDVKGQAGTGTGKTAAFLLPIIQKLATQFSQNPDEDRTCKVSALIIEPSREMIDQVYTQAVLFSANTGVRVNYSYGMIDMKHSIRILYQNGCDILIGTPGRLAHLIKDEIVSIKDLKILVLDECDTLLKESSNNEMDKILDLLPPVS